LGHRTSDAPSDDEHDPAYNPMIVKARHAVRHRKIGRDAFKLRPKKICHGRPSCQTLEFDLRPLGNPYH